MDKEGIVRLLAFSLVSYILLSNLYENRISHHMVEDEEIVFQSIKEMVPPPTTPTVTTSTMLDIGGIETAQIPEVKKEPELQKPKEPFPHDTKLIKMGSVKVGAQTFEFNPSDIRTVREDVFKEGHFSIFDVLVHLKERGDIEMEYHYDEDFAANVIDSMQKEEDWWYTIAYDGGWREFSNHRPDLYPWKDGTYLSWKKTGKTSIDRIKSNWRKEVIKLERNDGKVIIPEVIIRGKTTRKRIKDVIVTPHDFRHDLFQQGTITAIDAIASLGDADIIEYDLNWYESIGRAKVVKNYFVEAINRDRSKGRCGFVYETGPKGTNGNHIHLPSDARVLVSPEYVEFFWICI